MTNADKFKGIFGIYATELWAKPEEELLAWLNADVPDSDVGDTISRQAAINEVRWWSDQLVKTLRSGQAVNCEKTEGEVYLLDCIISGLGEIPSAQRWIPVTERLPNTCVSVIVSIHDDSGDSPWDYTSEGWMTPGKNWVVDNDINWDVVAWMPLPEPFK